MGRVQFVNNGLCISESAVSLSQVRSIPSTVLVHDTTYGDALFSFSSIVVIIVVNSRTGKPADDLSEDIGSNDWQQLFCWSNPNPYIKCPPSRKHPISPICSPIFPIWQHAFFRGLRFCGNQKAQARKQGNR